MLEVVRPFTWGVLVFDELPRGLILYRHGTLLRSG